MFCMCHFMDLCGIVTLACGLVSDFGCAGGAVVLVVRVDVCVSERLN